MSEEKASAHGRWAWINLEDEHTRAAFQVPDSLAHMWGVIDWSEDDPILIYCVYEEVAQTVALGLGLIDDLESEPDVGG